MEADYEQRARGRGVCRSCIMVEEQKYLAKFLALGATPAFTNKDQVMVVDVPVDRIDQFVNLYLKLMQNGRWNEYVGPKTGFYFKMPSGESRHYLLTAETQEAISRTIKEFIPNWDVKTDLWQWLASIDIYLDFLS